MNAKTATIVVIGLLLFISSGVGAGLLSQEPPSRGEPVVFMGTPAPPLPIINEEQIALGAQLYAQYCANCHGANLEGAPNWKTGFPWTLLVRAGGRLCPA